MATTWIKDGKPNLGMTLNGAISGLVAITAGCGNMTFGGGFLAGLVGGIIVVFSIEFIDKVLKIDDAVGAASAHGVVGAWGTLVIGLWGVDGDTGIGLFNGGGGSPIRNSSYRSSRLRCMGNSHCTFRIRYIKIHYWTQSF